MPEYRREQNQNTISGNRRRWDVGIKFRRNRQSEIERNGHKQYKRRVVEFHSPEAASPIVRRTLSELKIFKQAE